MLKQGKPVGKCRRRMVIMSKSTYVSQSGVQAQSSTPPGQVHVWNCERRVLLSPEFVSILDLCTIFVAHAQANGQGLPDVTPVDLSEKGYMSQNIL